MVAAVLQRWDHAHRRNPDLEPDPVEAEPEQHDAETARRLWQRRARGERDRFQLVLLGCVLTPIALAGWQAPCDASDFMAGGTPFQALTDIAGGDVGGGKS